MQKYLLPGVDRCYVHKDRHGDDIRVYLLLRRRLQARSRDGGVHDAVLDGFQCRVACRRVAKTTDCPERMWPHRLETRNKVARLRPDGNHDLMRHYSIPIGSPTDSHRIPTPFL